MKIILTFDVEQDCPPFFSTTFGVREGLPRVLDVLKEHDVQATFFFTGEIARTFPEILDKIREDGHEVGCHGLYHERFDKLSKEVTRKRIEEALKILGRVASFRAPNLQFPNEYYDILAELGIKVDSSKATYKGSPGIRFIGEVLEVPVNVSSIISRLPWRIQKRVHGRGSVIVYMFHPWEFVRMPKHYRIDCWFGTGEHALKMLARIIKFYKSLGAEFLTMIQFYHEYVKG
ncbi:polysaccharide deacetylase [Thermococcus chitonophagus]|uniref:Polysaccharide deacetylase n=1 Tax=Thermococcus chitonophagus TaxID=54262 RepID=A0A160VSN2_9EURY|nr:polysaccharide deacetylase family protein [Thermococcus chitonophagus]ASJ17241.1 polysaccharide deacetylase [Thermococcus chitonophagus]CUX77860.1 Polysaccharide deacetylase [Thermococcus chitonophagus]